MSVSRSYFNKCDTYFQFCNCTLRKECSKNISKSANLFLLYFRTPLISSVICLAIFFLIKKFDLLTTLSLAGANSMDEVQIK